MHGCDYCSSRCRTERATKYGCLRFWRLHELFVTCEIIVNFDLYWLNFQWTVGQTVLRLCSHSSRLCGLSVREFLVNLLFRYWNIQVPLIHRCISVRRLPMHLPLYHTPLYTRSVLLGYLAGVSLDMARLSDSYSYVVWKLSMSPWHSAWGQYRFMDLNVMVVNSLFLVIEPTSRASSIVPSVSRWHRYSWMRSVRKERWFSGRSSF